MNMLITGSSGLIGSEAVRFFDQQGQSTYGIDNNLRQYFFGPGGDTTWNLQNLAASTRRFEHHAIDIRDRQSILDFYASHRIDATIHCAAQPSHDLAAKMPFDDFETNATGTLNLLEAARRHAPESPFVFMSTNKVYGDAPNDLPLKELPHSMGIRRWPRWNFGRHADRQVKAQPFRRFKAGRRYPRPGVRPVFRNADGVPPRRLPHGPGAQRSRAAWIFILPCESRYQ